MGAIIWQTERFDKANLTKQKQKRNKQTNEQTIFLRALNKGTLESWVFPAVSMPSWSLTQHYLYQFFLTEKEQTKSLQPTLHNETGLPREKSLGVLSQRRCGMPDEDHSSLKPGSSKWNKSNLTYRCMPQGRVGWFPMFNSHNQALCCHPPLTVSSKFKISLR